METWLTLEHQMRAFIGLEDQLYGEDTPGTLWKNHIPVFEAIKKADSDLAVKHMTKVITYGYRNASKHYIKKQREINADGDNKDEAHDS